MSKTFGDLKAGDEVYVINGSDVKIVKVQITRATSIQGGVFMTIEDMDYILPINKSSFSACLIKEFYCNIDDAIKTMKERCESALQNYKRASGALNKLETLKRK